MEPLRKAWIYSPVSKRYIYDFDDLKPADISISMIAGRLAKINRFLGMGVRPISVAEHSIWVAEQLEQSPALARIGLMHDATEAFVGDIHSAIKCYLPWFKQLEQSVWEVLCDKYDLPYHVPKEIHEIDIKARAREREILLWGDGRESSWTFWRDRFIMFAESLGLNETAS